MFVLHGVAESPGTRKVLWMLEEMGERYALVEVDLARRGNQTPAFLRLNPNGTIPVLDHDGFSVWESNACLVYLADMATTVSILPKTTREKAITMQWMMWEATTLHPALHRAWLIRYHADQGADDDPDGHLAAVEDSHRRLRVLDGHLADSAFVTERFGIADIALGAAVAQAQRAQVPLKSYAHVDAWMARLSSRPAFKRTHPTDPPPPGDRPK